MTKPIDNAYTDFRVHYETCPRCRPYQPCDVARAIVERDAKPANVDGAR